MGKRFGEMTPISIHALQTECDIKMFQQYYPDKISIHALQTECDGQRHDVDRSGLEISIHALQTECDGGDAGQVQATLEFLSTHSKRSATSNLEWVTQ